MKNADYDPYDVFSFQGRIRRRDWWLTCLLVNFNASTASTIGAMAMPHLGLIFWIALNVVASWMVLAASVKRSHDRNEGGALPIVSFVFGWLIVGALVLSPHLVQDASARGLMGWFVVAFALVNAAIGLWLLISLGFLDGTPGANTYGVSPKGASASNYRPPRGD